LGRDQCFTGLFSLFCDSTCSVFSGTSLLVFSCVYSPLFFRFSLCCVAGLSGGQLGLVEGVCIDRELILLVIDLRLATYIRCLLYVVFACIVRLAQAAFIH